MARFKISWKVKKVASYESFVEAPDKAEALKIAMERAKESDGIKPVDRKKVFGGVTAKEVKRMRRKSK